MVVSPVSLTPEEVELPPGARQKMPTLLGLGAALGVPAPSEYEDVDPELDELDGPAGSASAAGGALAVRPGGSTLLGPSSTSVLASGGLAAELAAPDATQVAASVRRLAEFATRLSIGPLSRLWLPEVRAAVQVLVAAGKQRKEPTLSLVSGRLNALLGTASVVAALPGETPALEASIDVPALPGPGGSGTEGLASRAPGAPNLDAGAPENLSASTDPASTDPASTELASTDPASTDPASAERAATDPATDAVAPAETAKTPPDTALVLAAAEPLHGALREQMLHELTRLAGLLPEWPAAAQDLAEETRRRETRLVRELLESIDGLRRDHRARVSEQMRFEELATLPSETLAEEFETPVERAAELSRVLVAYRELRQSSAPDVGHERGVERALRQLERAQERFEDCDPERKDVQRSARAERRRAVTALCLELAERGELEQLELLEPLSVAERIERMRQWLSAGTERPTEA